MENADIDSPKSGGTTYDHVLKYTSIFGGVQGITILLAIVRNKCVAKLLGEVGSGMIDVYNHAMNLMSSATQFGIPVTAVRKLSELYEQGDHEAMCSYVRVIRSWSLLTALLGTLLCTALSPLISALFIPHDDATLPPFNYTWQFVMLAPIVGMLAISGAELAILKATRRLKELAKASVSGAVTTLLLTVPFYFVFGLRGVAPALVVSTLASMVINLSYSLPMFRWSARPFSVRTLRRGTEMVQLGVSYILAGLVASMAEMAVRAFIANHGSMAEVGLYGAGLALTVSYAKLVFVSMDADFYPRLSAIMNDRPRMNRAINEQIEVCVLLMGPFLILFALFVPFLIILLYKESYMPAAAMTLWGMFSMYFKAITTPVAYSALAKGDSVVYFVVELAYYAVFTLLVTVGYSLHGLMGCGVALTLAHLFDLLLVSAVYGVRYGFRLARRTLIIASGQGLLVAAGLGMAMQTNAALKYGVGLPILLLSLFVSLRLLDKETSFVHRLRRRWGK